MQLYFDYMAPDYMSFLQSVGTQGQKMRVNILSHISPAVEYLKMFVKVFFSLDYSNIGVL